MLSIKNLGIGLHFGLLHFFNRYFVSLVLKQMNGGVSFNWTGRQGILRSKSLVQVLIGRHRFVTVVNWFAIGKCELETVATLRAVEWHAVGFGVCLLRLLSFHM